MIEMEHSCEQIFHSCAHRSQSSHSQMPKQLKDISHHKKYVILRDRTTAFESYASIASKKDDLYIIKDRSLSNFPELNKNISSIHKQKISKSANWSDLRSYKIKSIPSKKKYYYLDFDSTVSVNNSSKHLEFYRKEISLIDEIVEIILEYLHDSLLLSYRIISKRWKNIIDNNYLWSQLYMRKYRYFSKYDKMNDFIIKNHFYHLNNLPITYLKFSKRSVQILYFLRHKVPLYQLSTRAEICLTSDGCLNVVNNSMLRSFSSGYSESIKTKDALRILPCSMICNINISYFEAILKGSGSIGIASISSKKESERYGFGSQEHVGWAPISYGFHTDTGDILYNDGSTINYGGKRIELDIQIDENGNDKKDFLTNLKDFDKYIVGCGINHHTNELFFTLNGQLLDTKEKIIIIKNSYAAAITLLHFNDSVVLNFGKIPFYFDIEKFCAQEYINRKKNDIIEDLPHTFEKAFNLNNYYSIYNS